VVYTGGMPEEPFTPAPVIVESPRSHKRRWVVLAIILVVLLGVGVYLLLKPDKAAAPDPKNSVTQQDENLPGLQLDPNKNYGDKYADGLLPVGDEQFTTTSAAKGKVYLCNNNFVPDSQAGAQTRGPWFVGTTKWDVNKKYSVDGYVDWDQQLSNAVSGATRTISTNNLPDHMSGVFPVASSDDAYQYDRNPNTISAQSLTYALAASPGYGDPQCMGGEVGVMLTGVALFNAFDAGGRDAGAWEIQDACEGHPQGSGLYHYHTMSSCIKDVSVSTVIGFALDGFPITGPKVSAKNILTTSDLDECHGITSEITLDGKKTKMYHYVMTQDFPYSASCFRAKAITPPGQHSGDGQGQQSQPPQGGQGSMPPPRRAP
jgi:hypothetical protein